MFKIKIKDSPFDLFKRLNHQMLIFKIKKKHNNNQDIKSYVQHLKRTRTSTLKPSPTYSHLNYHPIQVRTEKHECALCHIKLILSIISNHKICLIFLKQRCPKIKNEISKQVFSDYILNFFFLFLKKSTYYSRHLT